MKLAPLVVSLSSVLLTTACQAQEERSPADGGTPSVELSAGQAAPPAATESLERWAVLCEQSANGPCVIRQYLLRESDRRQILMAGVLPGDGAASASMRLVLPFGIDPTALVSIGVDGEALAAPPLRTCLPQGCEAVVSLEGEALALLRSGSRMEVGLQIAGGGSFVLPIDLTDFSAAFDRAVAGRGEGAKNP